MVLNMMQPQLNTYLNSRYRVTMARRGRGVVGRASEAASGELEGSAF